MDQNQNNLIPSSEELLAYFDLKDLPEDQKEQVVQGMMQHFSDIMVETMISSLTDAQAAELDQAMADPASAMDKVQDIASRVPGLHAKIQAAIARELEVLKAGFQASKK